MEDTATLAVVSTLAFKNSLRFIVKPGQVLCGCCLILFAANVRMQSDLIVDLSDLSRSDEEER